MRHPVKRAVRDVLVPAATQLPAVQSRAAAGCRRSRSATRRARPSRRTAAGANPSRGTGSRTSRFAPRKAPPGCTGCWAGPARAARVERRGPCRTRLHRAELLPLAGQRRRGLRRCTRRLRPRAPQRRPRRSRVREGRSPGHDLPASARRSRRGPHGQQFTRGDAVRTLNPRQVRAPARGGRARRSGFRFRHDGGARAGEHDRPDVAQRASRLPDDPGCPRRGRTRSDLHPVEELMTRSTRDQVLRSRLTMFPVNSRQPSRTETAGQPASRPARRNHARRLGTTCPSGWRSPTFSPAGKRSEATSTSPSRTSPSVTPPSSSPPSCRTAVARARTGATSSKAGCASSTPTTRKSSPPARFTTSRQVTFQSSRSRSRSSSSALSPTTRRRPRP